MVILSKVDRILLRLSWCHNNSSQRYRWDTWPDVLRVLCQQLMPLRRVLCWQALLSSISAAWSVSTHFLAIVLPILGRYYLRISYTLLIAVNQTKPHLLRWSPDDDSISWFRWCPRLFNNRISPWVFIARQVRGVLLTATPIRLVPSMWWQSICKSNAVCTMNLWIRILRSLQRLVKVTSQANKLFCEMRTLSQMLMRKFLVIAKLLVFRAWWLLLLLEFR